MVTAQTLTEQWHRTPADPNAVLFYGHSRNAGSYRSFSNFFEHDAPFEFTLPDFAHSAAFEASGQPRTVPCRFSEAAIMLCKAALMGDFATYGRIARARAPADAKKLGRKVTPFDPDRWDTHVCRVAVAVVKTKFAAFPGLKKVLLGTGTALIAEATRRDCIWGIGLNAGDDGAHNPRQWRGSNILGWALMTARAELALEKSAPPPLPPSGSGGGGEAAEAAATEVDQMELDQPPLAPSARRKVPCTLSSECNRSKRRGVVVTSPADVLELRDLAKGKLGLPRVARFVRVSAGGAKVVDVVDGETDLHAEDLVLVVKEGPAASSASSASAAAADADAEPPTSPATDTPTTGSSGTRVVWPDQGLSGFQTPLPGKHGELNWLDVGNGGLTLWHRPGRKTSEVLAAAGCTDLLTLLSAKESAEGIRTVAERGGMRWHWFPLAGGSPTEMAKPENRQTLLEAARTAAALLTAPPAADADVAAPPPRVLVHCSAGQHRTGTLAYLILRACQWPADRARAALGFMREATGEGVGDERIALSESLVGEL